MRLATFIAEGKERFGIVLSHPATGEDWVFDPGLTAARIAKYASKHTSSYIVTKPNIEVEGGWPTDMVAFLAWGEPGMSALRRLEDFLRRFLEQADQYMLLGAGFPLSQVRLRAPIPRPRLLFGLVQNSPTAWRHDIDRLHINLFPQGHQRPQGSVLGPGDPVVVPEMENPIGGWNPELGVIIGRGGRDIPIDETMSHVAGLTVVTDLVVNQFRTMLFAQSPPYDWFEDAMSSWGDKKADTRCPVGPFLVTMDEIGSPYDLMIYTRQSGWLRDRSHTGAMSIGIERTLSWLSSFRELRPGDVIHMATMGYDGMFITNDGPLGPDDYIESEIERVGVLRNPVVFEGPADWREPDDVTRRVHPAPAVRDLIHAGKTRIQRAETWQPADARHFWVLFGNYQQAEENEGIKRRPYPRFLNTPSTALAPAGHTIRLPPRARTLTLGCELACVVGRVARSVAEADAPDYILGYQVMAVLRDGSFADVVIEPASPQERLTPQVYARWGDGYNVIASPSIPSATEDVAECECELAVEGFGAVQGTTAEYLFAAPQVLAFISQYITLFPGDVIALGRLASLLTIPADVSIPAGTTGYARIAGVGRVTFALDDHRGRVPQSPG